MKKIQKNTEVNPMSSLLFLKITLLSWKHYQYMIQDKKLYFEDEGEEYWTSDTESSSDDSDSDSNSEEDDVNDDSEYNGNDNDNSQDQRSPTKATLQQFDVREEDEEADAEENSIEKDHSLEEDIDLSKEIEKADIGGNDTKVVGQQSGEPVLLSGQYEPTRNNDSRQIVSKPSENTEIYEPALDDGTEAARNEQEKKTNWQSSEANGTARPNNVYNLNIKNKVIIHNNYYFSNQPQNSDPASSQNSAGMVEDNPEIHPGVAKQTKVQLERKITVKRDPNYD